MIEIEDLRDEHLEQVRYLINCHLDAVIPGWGLPTEYIAARLQTNPEEDVVDPWVAERRSLVALSKDRVCAAAHMLRYGADTPVEPKGEICWLLALAEEPESARTVFTAAVELLQSWDIEIDGIGVALPTPVICGVSEAWPHLIDLFEEQGFAPQADTQIILYGGTLNQIPPPGEAPVDGVALNRKLGRDSCRFAARVNGERSARFECNADLTQGGRLPALNGWGELYDIGVKPEWSTNDMDTWVVRHAVQWLRLGGCDRGLMNVSIKDAAWGDRFFADLGWERLASPVTWWEKKELKQQ